VERCKAHRRDGSRCGRWPTTGSRTCRSHGSGAPQVQRAAARRVAEARTLRILAKHGTELGDNLDPLTALQVVTAQTVTLKEDLAARVAEMKVETWRYQDRNGGEQLRSEILLFERALERTARLLIDTSKLNLDARLVRISEMQVAAMIAVLSASLVELGVDPDDQHVRSVVGRQLAMVAP
jgi:hypothetical protein